MKITALCVILCAIFTTNASSTGVTERIRKKYSPDASLVISFEQSIYWSVREKTSKRSGKIILVPGEKFRVELGREIYISNGTVCWQYHKKNNQVTIRNLADINMSFHPSSLLSTFLNEYTFTEKDIGNRTTLLSAVDTSSGAQYRSVAISVKRATGIVTRLQYTDKNQNKHTYRFKKTEFNKNQPSSLFEFEVPADADIIDNR